MSLLRPRLTRSMKQDRTGHEFRYHLASGFMSAGQSYVLDAACGTGYGAILLRKAGYTTPYVGVDVDLTQLEMGWDPTGRVRFIKADLCTWMPDFYYDVFCSFETIEHLADYTNLIAMAKDARRWAILSVPTVPTKSWNHYHAHDFVPGQLQELMADEHWEHYQTVQQPAEMAEIAVFRRVSG